MTVTDLVHCFAEITDRQGQALKTYQIKQYKKLYGEMMDVANELKSRNGDQRRALMILYQHPAPKVRLMAAHMTLALAYPEARTVMQNIVDRQERPFAGDAAGTLRNLDSGFYKPT
ncbi:MAG TPA: DUF2019 domain-containing protein [Afipia sp.]